jgi:hypothetical protein
MNESKVEPMKMLKWLRSAERRRSPRSPVNGVVAFYWNGGVARSHAVREVSMHGAVVDTSEEWYPGTLIQLVVQRPPNGHGDSPELFVGLWGKVVRRSEAGICLDFVFQEPTERLRFQQFLEKARGRTL